MTNINEKTETILDTDEAWDDRTLGADEQFAVAIQMDEHAIDEALNTPQSTL